MRREEKRTLRRDTLGRDAREQRHAYAGKRRTLEERHAREQRHAYAGKRRTL